MLDSITLTLPAPARRRSIRVKANWSLRDAADHLGVTPEAVRLWETGQRNPTGPHASDYAQMLADLAA